MAMTKVIQVYKAYSTQFLEREAAKKFAVSMFVKCVL